MGAPNRATVTDSGLQGSFVEGFDEGRKAPPVLRSYDLTIYRAGKVVFTAQNCTASLVQAKVLDYIDILTPAIVVTFEVKLHQGDTVVEDPRLATLPPAEDAIEAEVIEEH